MLHQTYSRCNMITVRTGSTNLT